MNPSIDARAGLVYVTQADRIAGHAHAVTSGRIPPAMYRDAFERGEWDHTEDVQAFARHRLATLNNEAMVLVPVADLEWLRRFAEVRAADSKRVAAQVQRGAMTTIQTRLSAMISAAQVRDTAA